MSRRAWLLTALAVIIVLPVAAIGVALSLADPNDLKPAIEAAVQRATGRSLTLDGPIRVTRSFSPWIEVSQVRLSNLPGGSRDTMVRVDKIRAQISLLALLRQRIEVTHLELTGPNILFEEVKGQPNLVLPTHRRPLRDRRAVFHTQLVSPPVADPQSPYRQRHGDLASAGAHQCHRHPQPDRDAPV